jgi:hypothetical protein
MFLKVCRDRRREFAFALKDRFAVLSREIISVVLSRPARLLIGNKFGPFGIERWPITSPSAFYDILKFGEDRNREPIRFGPVGRAQATGEILASSDHALNRFGDGLTNSPISLPKLKVWHTRPHDSIPP